MPMVPLWPTTDHRGQPIPQSFGPVRVQTSTQSIAEYGPMHNPSTTLSTSGNSPTKETLKQWNEHLSSSLQQAQCIGIYAEEYAEAQALAYVGTERQEFEQYAKTWLSNVEAQAMQHAAEVKDCAEVELAQQAARLKQESLTELQEQSLAISRLQTRAQELADGKMALKETAVQEIEEQRKQLTQIGRAALESEEAKVQQQAVQYITQHQMMLTQEAEQAVMLKQSEIEKMEESAERGRRERRYLEEVVQRTQESYQSLKDQLTIDAEASLHHKFGGEDIRA